jgi:hypothetical protein
MSQSKTMEQTWRPRPVMPQLAGIALLVAIFGGCETLSPHTVSRNYSQRGDVPIDPPRPHSKAEDDCAEGGRLFSYYCGSCHNARALAERPFSNYHVVVTHMRDPAYLTGKEYRQIIMFLRRWHDVGPPTPAGAPSPKRFVFSQPIAELRGDAEARAMAPVPPPQGSGPFGQPAASGEAPASPRGSIGTPLPPLPPE